MPRGGANSSVGGSTEVGSFAGSSSGAGSTPSSSAGRAGSEKTGGAANMAGAATAGGAGVSGSAGGETAGGNTSAPAVRVVGRAVASGASIRFGWPGVALHARFRGTQVSIQLNDANHQNAFEVAIDDQPPRKFRTSSGTSSYQLATGLPAAEHRVVLWRSTEVFDSGNTDFVTIGDFGDGGALLAPPPAPDRRVEIIGDSISVGAGLEGGAGNCAANKSSTDNYYAYGSVAARALGADVSTIAYSGIGVYRSYGKGDLTMPARYDRSLPNENGGWDFSKYQPDVAVINLGTNDFGIGDPGQAYVDAYVSFAKHVRSKYSKAYFVLIAMYGHHELPHGKVVDELKRAGETKVELLKFSSVQNNKGCAQHPDRAGQQAMGELLASRLRSVMNW